VRLGKFLKPGVGAYAGLLVWNTAIQDRGKYGWRERRRAKDSTLTLLPKVGLLPFNQVLSKSYRRHAPCFKNWSSSCFGARLMAHGEGKHAHCCRLDCVITLASPWRLFSPHPGGRRTAVDDPVYQV